MAGMAVRVALLLGLLLVSHHPGDTGEAALPPRVGSGVVGALGWVILAGRGGRRIAQGGFWGWQRVLGGCVSHGRVPLQQSWKPTAT